MVTHPAAGIGIAGKSSARINNALCGAERPLTISELCAETCTDEYAKTKSSVAHKRAEEHLTWHLDRNLDPERPEWARDVRGRAFVRGLCSDGVRWWIDPVKAQGFGLVFGLRPDVRPTTAPANQSRSRVGGIDLEKIAHRNVTQDFQKWGKGFSGCDGGNLHGAVWFCGIEWGTGKDHDLEKELKLSVSDPPQIYQSPGEILNYPLGIKLIKLITAMRGGSVHDYRRIAHEIPFPFHRNSDFFKMNLFPVAFRKVDAQLWIDKYQVSTGLATREAYLEWCRQNRFPKIRSWVETGQPKLIVGIGTSCKYDFQEAFGFNVPENEETIEDRKLVWMSDGEVVLAVIPFLGQFQLDSNQRLQAFGERLGAILNGRDCQLQSTPN